MTRTALIRGLLAALVLGMSGKTVYADPTPAQDCRLDEFERRLLELRAVPNSGPDIAFVVAAASDCGFSGLLLHFASKLMFGDVELQRLGSAVVRTAAEQGDVDAQVLIAETLTDGMAGRTDLAQAYFWILTARLCFSNEKNKISSPFDDPKSLESEVLNRLESNLNLEKKNSIQDDVSEKFCKKKSVN